MAKRAPRTGSPRTSVLGVRVLPEQRAEIEADAIAAGMTVSAYIAATLAKARDGRRRPFDASVDTLKASVSRAHLAVNSPSCDASNESVAASRRSNDDTTGDVAVNSHAILLDSVGHPIRKQGVGPSGVSVQLGPTTALTVGPSQRIATRLDTTDTGHGNLSIGLSDPSALYELKRIGNNLNQIAHAVNAGLPPSAKLAVDTFRHLFEALTDAPEFRRRLDALKMKRDFNGTAHPQTRIELPGGVPLRSARPREEQ